MTLFDFSSIPESPWPKKGDELFIHDNDWWNNAYINPYLDNWELYTSGYKRAGDVLIEHAKEASIDRNLLVFPIVFVYRQYLELSLKKLIRDCKSYLGAEPKFPVVHELDTLWKEFTGLIVKVEPRIEIQDLEAVDESIQQFCKVDQKSMAFRYPINKNGSRSLPRDLEHINLRNLSEVINKVSSFLEGTSMMISVYLDNKREMEQEFKNSFGE